MSSPIRPFYQGLDRAFNAPGFSEAVRLCAGGERRPETDGSEELGIQCSPFQGVAVTGKERSDHVSKKSVEVLLFPRQCSRRLSVMTGLATPCDSECPSLGVFGLWPGGDVRGYFAGGVGVELLLVRSFRRIDDPGERFPLLPCIVGTV